MSDTQLDLAARLDIAYRLADRAASTSFLGYLQSAVIDSRPEPRRFAQVADSWQWERATMLAPAVESVAGLHEYHGPQSFWTGMPRGHNKTGAISSALLWLLRYSRHPITAITAAADQEQAGHITSAMENEYRLNPWLGEGFIFTAKRVYGPTLPGGGRSRLKVLNSDASSEFGHTGDIYVLDELTHWKKRDLWDALWSGREKRPGSIVWVISNAGTIGSWQHQVHETGRADPTWNVYEAPGWMASWMPTARIQAMRAMLPGAVARRVIDNVWIDPAEESGYLTRADVASCVADSIHLVPVFKGDPRIRYVAAIDYGPKRDRTALAVVHRDEQDRVVVDRLDVWQGSPDTPIQVAAVEAWIDEVNQSFRRPLLVVDPYQMEGTVQRYEKGQRVERFEARGGKANYELAETVRSLVVNRRLLWYATAGSLGVAGSVETLADELVSVVLKPTLYGYRVDHVSTGHDDRVVAVGMAALAALRGEPRAAVGIHKVVTPDQISLQRRPDAASRWNVFGVGR